MFKALTRYWGLMSLRGVAAILFGLMALIWPGLTVGVMVAMFGAYALVDGVFSIGAAIQGDTSDRWWQVFSGVTGILVGVIAWVWPGLTALSLLAFIAAWAILTGTLEMVAAFRFRKVLDNEWLIGLGGLTSVLFGVVLVAAPGEGAIALVWLIGSYAIFFGVLMVIAGFRFRALGEHGEERRHGGSPFSGNAPSRV